MQSPNQPEMNDIRKTMKAAFCDPFTGKIMEDPVIVLEDIEVDGKKFVKGHSYEKSSIPKDHEDKFKENGDLKKLIDEVQKKITGENRNNIDSWPILSTVTIDNSTLPEVQIFTPSGQTTTWNVINQLAKARHEQRSDQIQYTNQNPNLDENGYMRDPVYGITWAPDAECVVNWNLTLGNSCKPLIGENEELNEELKELQDLISNCEKALQYLAESNVNKENLIPLLKKAELLQRVKNIPLATKIVDGEEKPIQYLKIKVLFPRLNEEQQIQKYFEIGLGEELPSTVSIDKRTSREDFLTSIKNELEKQKLYAEAEKNKLTMKSDTNSVDLFYNEIDKDLDIQSQELNSFHKKLNEYQAFKQQINKFNEWKNEFLTMDNKYFKRDERLAALHIQDLPPLNGAQFTDDMINGTEDKRDNTWPIYDKTQAVYTFLKKYINDEINFLNPANEAKYNQYKKFDFTQNLLSHLTTVLKVYCSEHNISMAVGEDNHVFVGTISRENRKTLINAKKLADSINKLADINKPLKLTTEQVLSYELGVIEKYFESKHVTLPEFNGKNPLDKLKNLQAALKQQKNPHRFNFFNKCTRASNTAINYIDKVLQRERLQEKKTMKEKIKNVFTRKGGYTFS